MTVICMQCSLVRDSEGGTRTDLRDHAPNTLPSSFSMPSKIRLTISLLLVNDDGTRLNQGTLFVVRVPVLSLQIVVADPIVSQAAK